MKRKEWFSISARTLCIGAMATLMAACGGKKEQQAMPPAQVETYTVNLGSATLNQEYPATIKGEKDIDIHPQVSGFITKVCVDEGQAVRKGQVLFVLDQVQLQAAVNSAKAAVEAARSQVATQQLTTNNKKVLYSKNIISDYEYQTAQLALQSAKASLSQAVASLVNARKNLSYAVVKSPIDGVVGSIPNREGSLVGPSTAALTTISNIGNIYAYFSLNEKDMLTLTENGTITLERAIMKMPRVQLRLSDGSIYAITGKVSTVSGVLGATTGSATVRALFKNTNGMLRSGSTGTILVPQPSSHLMIIPQKATYEIQDKKYVYLVGDSSKAVSTPITVSPVDDGQTYIVTSGLKVGDVIVTEGVGTLVKDGVVVQPKSAATKPAATAAKSGK